MDFVADFLAWLERTKLTETVIIDKIEPDHVGFSLKGWPYLVGSLRDNGIDIYAMRQGECWDILWCSDIAPHQTEDGWVCWMCQDASDRGLYPPPERFSTARALWTTHTFEALQHWIASDLDLAEGIGYWGKPDCATWAKLVFAPAVRASGERTAPLEVVERVLFVP